MGPTGPPRPPADVRGRPVVVGCDVTVLGNPGWDWKVEGVTGACTGGDEKAARGCVVSCGGVDGSKSSVDERTSAKDENWRSEEIEMEN